jgi:hypothetical protein
MVHLKFEVLFITFLKFQKHHFPQKTSGLAKGVVNCMDGEIYLLENCFS